MAICFDCGLEWEDDYTKDKLEDKHEQFYMFPPKTSTTTLVESKFPANARVGYIAWECRCGWINSTEVLFCKGCETKGQKDGKLIC